MLSPDLPCNEHATDQRHDQPFGWSLTTYAVIEGHGYRVTEYDAATAPKIVSRTYRPQAGALHPDQQHLWAGPSAANLQPRPRTTPHPKSRFWTIAAGQPTPASGARTAASNDRRSPPALHRASSQKL